LREALADYDTQAGFTLKAYDVLMQRADPQRSTLGEAPAASIAGPIRRR
jgi:hypothetical protein